MSEERPYMSKLWNVAVVGATGAVGAQMIECLEERDFPVGKIKYLASARSAGEILEFRGKPVVVEELTHDSFDGIDIAIFSAGGDRSREFCPSAARAGAEARRRAGMSSERARRIALLLTGRCAPAAGPSLRPPRAAAEWETESSCASRQWPAVCAFQSRRSLALPGRRSPGLDGWSLVRPMT